MPIYVKKSKDTKKVFSKRAVIELCRSAFDAGSMHCATEGKIYPRSDDFDTWLGKHIKP